jgi:hypothetical protein
LDSTPVGRAGVLQTERHGQVTIRVVGRNERCLDLVFNFQANLVIARIAVEKTKQGTTRRGINDLVYSREGEGVFGAVFVDISIINTHSPFFILYKN